MSWEEFAVVSPDFDWTTIDTLVEGYASFKVSHSWNPIYSYPGTGAAWLTQIWPDGSRGKFRKLWPHRDPRIVSFHAPADLTASNDDSYRLSVKRTGRARIYGDAHWQIRIWRWAEIPLDDYEFDPGEYYDNNTFATAPEGDPLFDGGLY